MLDCAKVCDCEKFIKGQNVIILTRVTSNMLSSGQQNCGGHGLVLQSMIRHVLITFYTAEAGSF